VDRAREYVPLRAVLRFLRLPPSRFADTFAPVNSVAVLLDAHGLSRESVVSRSTPAKRLLRTPRFAPTDTVAHCGVRRRHRLQSNPMSWRRRRVMRACDRQTQPVRCECACVAIDTPLLIDQRHAMHGPGQVVRGPLRAIAHPPARSVADSQSTCSHRCPVA
jgi:hypothetical protein